MANNTPRGTKQETSVLRELHLLHETLADDLEKSTGDTRFLEALRKANIEVKTHQNKDLAESLVQYWLDYLEITVMSTNQTTLTSLFESLDRVLEMVLEHELLDDITKSSRHASMLAWICLAKVVLDKTNVLYLRNDDVRKIVGIWSGKPDTRDMVLSVENTVQILYGHGVWELYATDVETLKVPRYLLTSKVAARVPKSEVSQGPADLPNSS